jgi:hypothetical protein
MKAKISIVAVLFAFFSIFCNAQEYKQSWNWITGYSGNKISFDGGNITTTGGVYFPLKYFSTGSSSISDLNGNLILASDGYNIYNAFGSYIEGGDTLVPINLYNYYDGHTILSQSSIFLPINNNDYYFITPAFSNPQFANCLSNNNCHFDLLLYNLIDMNANGGLGKVTKRMVPLMQNANLRKTQMMACRHGNGKDWWLLKNEGDYGDVHTFLFTQDSVYDKGIQVFAQPNWGPWDIRGQSTFNSDGSMFATASHCSSCGLIFIADFDRCHGILNKPSVIERPWGSMYDPIDTAKKEHLVSGLCFSPNGQFLYVSGRRNIYQYDLQDSTWYKVVGLDTSYTEFQDYETLYNAPDGKIYVGNFAGLSKQMSRIDNPDVKGAGCNFCPRCLRLDSLGANAYVGTPPCMPNYGLGAKTCWPLSHDDVLVGDDHLAVYPNPANNILNFKNKTGKRKYLYNTLGQLIRTTQTNEMDVRGLHPGVYYVQCDGETRKVIVE